MDEKLSINNVKGTVHQIINFRINLIFWIVMEGDIAHLVRRGLKTTYTGKNGKKKDTA